MCIRDRAGRTLDVAEIDGEAVDVEVGPVAPDRVSLSIDGITRHVLVERHGATTYVDGPDGSAVLEEVDRFPLAADQLAEGSALAPMPGGVVRVHVVVGDTVETGQPLVVLEAMKMEHAVHATTAGTVTEVLVAEGDQVETGRTLVVVEPDAGDGEGEGAEPAIPSGSTR